MRRAIVRPRAQSKPTPVADILRVDPLARELQEDCDRREAARRDGTGTMYGPGFYTLSETRNMPRAADDFVVADGILTKRGKLLLYAAAGAGKTTLGHHLACCLASAVPFLGRFAVDRSRRVLFVQGELAPAELGSHGQNLLAVFSDTAAPDGLVFWLNKSMKLPQDMAHLRGAIEMVHAEAVVIDPFIRFFRGENSTQPEEVSRFFESLDTLLDDVSLGVEAVVVMHHMNVAQARTAGSWAFEGWPSTILRLDPVKGRPDCRRLQFEKVRSPDSTLLNTSLTVRLGEDGYLVDEAPRDNIGPDGRGIGCLVDFIRAAGGEAWRTDAVAHLKATLGVQDRQATNILSAATKVDVIRSVKFGRNVRLSLVADINVD